MHNEDACFTPFSERMDLSLMPTVFTNPFHYTPHPYCLQAAEQLQHYLSIQTDWVHNFGLNDTDDTETVIGKMFGVLVIQNQKNEFGYIAAFSGKLANSNQHTAFVPPVFDMLTEDSFLTVGMKELQALGLEIATLEALESTQQAARIAVLKHTRKTHSNHLQNKLFDHYTFLNQSGKIKSLRELFKSNTTKNPPSAAGECAAPKLLQHAFLHNYKPIALAEFWWGLSPKSATWKHKQYYPACQEKCAPILAHMLEGIELEG
jgi:tRNA pseudouridine32 synthase / 23S rRNA pseudouridine746 synthase